MKKIVTLFMLLAFCGFACNKDLSRTVNKEDAPYINVSVENVDDEDDSTGGNNNDSINEGGNPAEENDEISIAEKNEFTVYSFMGVSGLYFGCSSSFKTNKETLEFIFGTSKTTNLKITQEDFEQLIHTGERQFGSLGAYTSYPERFSDKVEIAFTDKKGRRWCSTRIIEKKTSDGIETSVKVEQDNAEFSIEDAHKIEIAAETEGYRLKGKFKCMLYEVNGKAKKKMKGNFTGIVGLK